MVEARPEEVSPAEVRLAEVCLAEARLAEVRPPEVRPAEVGLAEVRLAEVRLAEVRTSARVLVTPRVPGGRALLEQCDVLLVRHRSILARSGCMRVRPARP